MTLAIMVKNNDDSRTAFVIERTYSIGIYPATTSDNKVLLGPGECMTFHIHAAKQLIIQEDPNITQPKKIGG